MIDAKTKAIEKIYNNLLDRTTAPYNVIEALGDMWDFSRDAALKEAEDIVSTVECDSSGFVYVADIELKLKRLRGKE